MGEKFSIAEDAVVRHARNIDGSVSALDGNLRKFEAALEPLPAVWRGAAFGSFAEVQRKLQAAKTEMNQALANVAAKVGDSGAVYNQYHAEQTQALQGVAGSANWDAAKFRD